MIALRAFHSVSRRVATAAPRVAQPRVVALRPLVAARWFAGVTEREDKALEERLRVADKSFLDAETALGDVAQLPVRQSGRVGEIAGQLYREVPEAEFEEVAEQLHNLANIFESLPDQVRRVFLSSSFSPEECWEALNLLFVADDFSSFDKLSDRAKTALVEDAQYMEQFAEAAEMCAVDLNEHVETMLGRLADAGRLDLFFKTKDAFFQLAKAAGNGVSITVLSAVPLNAAQVAKVEKIIQMYVDDDEYPLVNYEVDSDLVGGVQLRVENTISDASVDGILREVAQSYE